MPRSLKVCFPFFVFFTFLTFWVRDNAFFWDTVQLASRHAHWYFDNNFKYFFLPENMDSGHPPFFGILLALMWKLFGKTLWVSHFMILPFLIGIVYYLHRLGEYFLGKGKSIYLLLLVTVDPVFIAQSVLVSPDVLVIFGWLMALWAIISGKRVLLFLATFLLAAISLRGMMVVFSVFLFDLYRLYNDKITWSFFWKIFLYYLPSGLFALIFLYLHFDHTGWIGHHENSPWSPSFERVTFHGFLRNIGFIGWRLLDFGRIFLWLLIGWGFFKVLKSGLKLDNRFKEIMALVFITFAVLSPSMLLHKGLMAHRYLLPVMLSINLFTIALLFKLDIQIKFKNIIYTILFLGLATGNLWVYPKKIAQGWDSTLGHLPYYGLRIKMHDFLEKNEIPIEAVGTEFPMVASLENLDLNGRREGFHVKDFEKDNYILYTNIINEFQDEEFERLETDFEIVKEFHSGQVCMILYKRKK